jgi:transposase
MKKPFVCLSDSQWSLICHSTHWTPPPVRGVPRADFRKIWNAILYVLIRGCRWVDLPKDSRLYCSKSTAHRWLLILKREHVLDRVLSQLLLQGLHEGKIDLSQVAVDGSFSPRTGRR